MINLLLQILFLIISYIILKDILVQKQIDNYKKKNKTGALVCGILGLCCLIGNVALTTFIK